MDCMLAASNRATETMVSVGKRLVAALLQSPVADLDTPAFAAQTFTARSRSLFGISFLRGSLVTDALVLSAQMHANKPLVVDSVVGGRDVRVLNPDFNQWDQTTHLAVGRIVQQRLSGSESMTLYTMKDMQRGKPSVQSFVVVAEQAPNRSSSARA